MIREAKSD